MSKSKGNVIDPDEQIKLVGADTVKMYLAFMGPYEGSNYPFDLGGIAGVRRFLERVYGLSEHIKDTEDIRITKAVHKTIAKVTTDIKHYKFNTAISSMMKLINECEKNGLSEASYLTFLTLLAPFAPHLTEELWEQSGNTGSIHHEHWPIPDEQFLIDDEVTIGVQFNGKRRGDITIPVDTDESTVMELVKNDPKLTNYLPEIIKKVVYVPKRILNIIS